MRKDAPLAVDLPSEDRDSPGWVKVGVIAAVGFVIGIAWPRVMGVKLGPSAPGESASASASGARGQSGRAPDAPSASVAANAKGGAPSLSATTIASGGPSGSASNTPPGGPPQINVQKGAVISCKTSDGDVKKGKECGGVPGLDQLVAPRIRKVATCGAAEGQTGKLSFVVNADFGKGTFGWDVGKSSTVGNLDGITGCLKTHFQGVGTAGVAHEHAKYTVAYTATFAPGKDEAKDDAKDTSAKSDKPDAKDQNAKAGGDKPDDKGDKPEPGVIAAGGEATIGWEVALVRDAPKTGSVVARLPRGTKVKIGASKDGWYAIKYGDGFGSDGFVYRGALAK